MGKKTAVTIDRMRKEDLVQVVAIEGEAFSAPWSRNLFLSEFRDPAISLALVAIARGSIREINGYIVSWVTADELHILNLATQRQYRQKGIAKELVVTALRQAFQRGARRAFLEVRASNDPALRMYRNFGFVTTAVRKDYYDLPIEDAVVMTLEKDEYIRLINAPQGEDAVE